MPTVNGISFDRTLDAVDDLGIDPNGGNDAASILENNTGDGDLVQFPPGTYMFRSMFDDERHRFGLVGTGDTKEQVRFTAPPGNNRIMEVERGSDDVLWKNWVIDQGQNWNKLIGTWVKPSGEMKIIDCGLVGTEPSESDVRVNRDSGSFVLVHMGGTSGHVHIDGWTSASPAHYDVYPANRSFFQLGRSDGSVTMENCHIKYGSGSVLYGGKDSMDVTVRNCRFANIRDKCLRLSKRSSTVEGCVFVMDMSNDHSGHRLTESGMNTRLVWAMDGPKEFGGMTVRDCDFVLRNPYGNGVGRCHAVKVDDERAGPNPGAPKVTNCRFLNNGNEPSIDASNASSITTLEVDGCHFTGHGDAPAVVGDGVGYVRNCCDSMTNGGGISGASTSNISSSGCEEAKDDITFPSGCDSDADCPDGMVCVNGTCIEPTPDYDNTLTVAGTGTATNYRVETEGELNVVGGLDGTHESAGSDWVEAWVTEPSHVDEIDFNGVVTAFDVMDGGPVDVALNGESVDPTQDPTTWENYNNGGGPEPSPPPGRSTVGAVAALAIAGALAREYYRNR